MALTDAKRREKDGMAQFRIYEKTTIGKEVMAMYNDQSDRNNTQYKPVKVTHGKVYIDEPIAVHIMALTNDDFARAIVRPYWAVREYDATIIDAFEVCMRLRQEAEIANDQSDEVVQRHVDEIDRLAVLSTWIKAAVTQFNLKRRFTDREKDLDIELLRTYAKYAKDVIDEFICFRNGNLIYLSFFISRINSEIKRKKTA